MSVRATTTHVDKYGITHRIDLIQTGYGGSPKEFQGTSGFIVFDHENFSEANIFSTPVQKARLNYGFWINDGDGETVFNQVLASNEGDFLIEWYRESVLFWTGYVAPDLSSITETAFPREAVIVAKDLTILEGQTYSLRDTRETVIAVLADALNAVYAIPITTRTSWVCDNTTTADDFLRQAYIDTRALRLFAEDPDDDVALTAYAVVELLARNFKLFIRQTNGVWLIEQMSAHTTPASVLTTLYDSNGAFLSASNTNPVIVANSEVSVVTGSVSAITPAYRRVSSTFDHRTRVSGITYPQFINLTTQFPGPRVDSMFFIVDGTQTITLTGRVFVVFSEAVPESSISVPPGGLITIRYGDVYWDDVALEWTSVETENIIELRDSENKDGTDRDGTVMRKGFTGTVNFTTTQLPSNPTGNNTIVVTLRKSPSPGTSITTYNGLNFSLSNSDEEKGSSAIVFNLDQAGQSSVIYNDGVTYYGTGPSNSAMSAVRFSEVAPEPFDTKLITSWNRRGTAPSRLLHENLTKEVMDSQRSFRRILQAVLRKQYSPFNTLSYDTKSWFYIGGRFDGYTGDWEVTLAENAFSIETDTFVVAITSPGTNITSSFLTATSFATMDAIEATEGYLYRLSLSASGTISQLTVYGSDVTVKAGQILRLVNPITLQSEEVTVTADKVGDTVFVTTKTLTNNYPAGAYVYVSAQSQQAGIIVGENAVRIYAEGQKVGRLNGALTGLVTSISCFLNTRVIKGTELQVVNSTTGDSYSITVDDTADTYGPGSVSLAIESQIIEAPNGSYIVGDNAWQSSAITVTQGLIVLKVDSAGRVATVKLSADQDSGSEIDISAEQVKINDIIFTESVMGGEGRIASDPYTPGSAGWKIDGDGTAEFNDVTVRGSLQTSTIEGDLTMDGGSIKNTANTYVIDEDGIEFSGGTYNASGSVIVWNNGISTEYGRIAAGDISGANVMAILGNASGYIRLSVGTVDPDEEQIKIYASYVQIGTGKQLRVIDTTDSSSKDTGSIITEGGIGIEKNAYIGGLLNAPKVTITPITDSDSPYTVLSTDTHIAVDNGASAVTVNLPTGTDGRKITIYDRAGTASLGTITINRASTNTINGSTSTTLTTNYQSVTLLFYSGNWTII